MESTFVTITEKSFGFEIRLGQFIFVFGNKRSSLEEFKTHFSNLDFMRIKQTHSDLCIAANPLTPPLEADAHWTAEAMKALCISTADCVPVLIAEPISGTVLSIHAGWRGVANRIIPKSLDVLKKNNINVQNCLVLIGPHIQYQSFEVGSDVHSELLNSTLVDPHQLSLVSKSLPSGKHNVDLNALVKMQLAELELPAERGHSLHYDTKTNLDFHSYRRDKEQSGRQISFVAKIN